jgi:hypothetical protein
LRVFGRDVLCSNFIASCLMLLRSFTFFLCLINHDTSSKPCAPCSSLCWSSLVDQKWLRYIYLIGLFREEPIRICSSRLHLATRVSTVIGTRLGVFGTLASNTFSYCVEVVGLHNAYFVPAIVVPEQRAPSVRDTPTIPHHGL